MKDETLKYGTHNPNSKTSTEYQEAISSTQVGCYEGDEEVVGSGLLPTRGLHIHRLETNPLEKLFADEWRIQQRVHTFAYLMNCNNKADYDSFTKRDSRVAATVIQWLGSLVGQGFLREVQRKAKDL